MTKKSFCQTFRELLLVNGKIPSGTFGVLSRKTGIQQACLRNALGTSKKKNVQKSMQYEKALGFIGAIGLTVGQFEKHRSNPARWIKKDHCLVCHKRSGGGGIFRGGE